MASNELSYAIGEDGRLAWPRYFPRRVVTAADLNAGQESLLARLRRHNRYLHGFGVVCGLAVTSGALSGGFPTVTVSPGYAINPDGDEILVPDVQTVIIECVENARGDCTNLDLEAPPDLPVYLVVRYQASKICPAPALPDGCNQRVTCEESRWQEGFVFTCLEELPPAYGEKPPCDELIERFLEAQNPACADLPPGGPDVLLACLTITRGQGGGVTGVTVDNTCRRILYSVTTVQDLLRCLPARPQQPPVRVTAVTPPTGTIFTLPFEEPPASVQVVFSRPVDPASVTGVSLTVQRATLGSPGTRVDIPGSVTYLAATQTATFTPNSAFPINHIFTITALGDGPSPIRDLDGLRLDGNGDGFEGGNFISSFTILEIIDPHLGHDDEHDSHFHFEHHEREHEHFHFEHHEREHEHFHFELHEHEPEHDLEHIDHHFDHGFEPFSTGPGLQPAGALPGGPFFIPIEAVPGITPALADNLRANGITSASELGNLDVVTLARLVFISEDAAGMLIRIARDM